MRKAIEAVQKATEACNRAAQNKDKLSRDSKDLMLSLSTGISALQFASYQAMTQAAESKAKKKERKDFASTALNNFERSLSHGLSGDDDESEMIKKVTYKVLQQIKEAQEEDSDY